MEESYIKKKKRCKRKWGSYPSLSLSSSIPRLLMVDNDGEDMTAKISLKMGKNVNDFWFGE